MELRGGGLAKWEFRVWVAVGGSQRRGAGVGVGGESAE